MKHAAWVRPAVGLVAAVATALVSMRFVETTVAIAVAWVVFAGVYIVWTWAALQGMSPDETKSHATREDPSRSVAASALLVASVASIGGVAMLLAAGSQGTHSVVQALLGVLTVAASWLLVHTIYTLHYARIYYTSGSGPDPIDYNDDPDAPDYHDFAYVALTLGMTYQVSDTSLNTKPMRRAVLRHALLSYLLGAIVVASTVNLVAQLASSGG